MRFVVRMIKMLAAYIASVLGLLAALAVLFGLGSLMPGAPGYWTLTAVSPAIFIGAPVLGVFVVLLVVVLSAGPALLVLAATEVLGWRSIYVYAIPSALLSVVVYLEFSPRTIDWLDPIGMLEAGTFALSGAAAGCIYWALAGRTAGIWRSNAIDSHYVGPRG